MTFEKKKARSTIYNLRARSKVNGITKTAGNSVTLIQGNMPKIFDELLIVFSLDSVMVYCKAIEVYLHRQVQSGIIEPGNWNARVIDRPRIIEISTNDLPLSRTEVNITIPSMLKEFFQGILNTAIFMFILVNKRLLHKWYHITETLKQKVWI